MTPLSITNCDWTDYSSTWKGIFGYSPLVIIDKERWNKEDPAAFLAGLNNRKTGVENVKRYSSHVYMTWIHCFEEEENPLIIPRILNVTPINTCHLISGSIRDLVEASVEMCETENRTIGTAIFMALRQTKFKHLYDNFKILYNIDQTVKMESK